MQVRGVALQFRATAIKSSRAKNKSKALGQFKRVQNLAHLAALLLVLNLAADANFVHVRHHHQQTARHADITGERWTLGANALLDHLHGDLLTLLHAILNGWSIVARNFVANAFSLDAARKIFWMQITNVQESVLAFTKINESGLNCGLYIGDAALVNVAHIRGAGHALGEIRLKSAAAHKGHATFVAGNFIHNHNRVARFRRFAALHNSAHRFCWRAIGGDILGGALNIVASLGGFNYFCAFFKRVAFRGDVIGFFNLLNFFNLFKRVIAVDFRVVRYGRFNFIRIISSVRLNQCVTLWKWGGLLKWSPDLTSWQVVAGVLGFRSVFGLRSWRGAMLASMISGVTTGFAS